jgi:hypothetical protein
MVEITTLNVLTMELRSPTHVDGQKHACHQYAGTFQQLARVKYATSGLRNKSGWM